MDCDVELLGGCHLTNKDTRFDIKILRSKCWHLGVDLGDSNHVLVSKCPIVSQCCIYLVTCDSILRRRRPVSRQVGASTSTACSIQFSSYGSGQLCLGDSAISNPVSSDPVICFNLSDVFLYSSD